MRLAIFDGIAETHVGSSLERAFVSRGHDVLNTGRVGHGFRFPAAGADVSHLQHAISQVLAHEPDWVIVMRPASLPPRLLERLRSTGARLAVWLSDDPVLFHLSYAPVLEHYDVVLHCGTADVLQYYEDFFGRATGVNFPFWTDHHAFPYVWGSEQPESTGLFLGNVHDHIRRRRYFALGHMATDVRIHGNVGTDYLALGAGYLDSDAEVVNAGARARIAINIPQFFRDHRGLPTWFPGLDDLGFFEYPSRVVQYIAMGLPVISIVPGGHRFESLPEMIVAEDTAEADAAIAQLHDGDLEALSKANERRFAMHFSAGSRVLAFEALAEDDSWRRLDAVERNVWFTGFDGSISTSATGGTSRGFAPRIEVSGAEAERVVVLGKDLARPTSRMAVTVRALTGLGFDVIVAGGDDDSVIEGAAQAATGLVVCGKEAAAAIPQSLPESAWRVMIDDTSTEIHEVRSSLSLFDAVGLRDAGLHDVLSAAGHARVKFCPPNVDSAYVQLVGTLSDVKPLVRTTSSIDMDARFAPALNSDVMTSAEDVHNHRTLAQLPLEELARRVRSRIAVVGFSGTPSAAFVDDVVPFIAAAADVLVIPRLSPATTVSPYPSFALQVQERGELATKLHRLADSASLRDTFTDAELPELLNAELSLGNLIVTAVHARAGRGAPGYDRGLSGTQMVSAPIPVPPVEGGAAQRTVDLAVSVRDGDHASHVMELLEGDAVVHSERSEPVMKFIVRAKPGRALAPLSVRLRFVGRDCIAPAETLVSLVISGSRFTGLVTADDATSGTSVARML